jgi:hypothetical protein
MASRLVSASRARSSAILPSTRCKRRIVGLDGRDDRVGRAHRIARLLAAALAELLPARAGRVGVGVDGRLGNGHRPALEVGAERTRLDQRDADAEVPRFRVQRLRHASTANLVAQ